MRILLGKTPRSTSSLSIGPRSRRAAKKRNELPPELRGRATIVRDVLAGCSGTSPVALSADSSASGSSSYVNRIFRRAACFLARFVELGGGLS
jgi:hypothetical protein